MRADIEMKVKKYILFVTDFVASKYSRWVGFGDGFRIGSLPHTSAATGYGTTTSPRQNNQDTHQNTDTWYLVSVEHKTYAKTHIFTHITILLIQTEKHNYGKIIEFGQ